MPRTQARRWAVTIVCALALSAIPLLSAVAVTEPEDDFWSGPLVEDAGDQTAPAIDAGVVVWKDASPATPVIRSADLADDTERDIYTSGDSHYPDISGDFVVWEEYSADLNGDIRLRDLSGALHSGTSFVVADGLDPQTAPAVHGDVVVWERWSSATSSDIRLRDLGADTTMTVCDATGDQTEPDVYGDIVVWQDERGADADIYMYDLATDTESAVCTATGDQVAPSIHGDVIAWGDARDAGDSGYDVYMYDLSTGTESAVCTATGDQAAPWQSPVDVSGDLIVWEDSRGDTDDVYAYDLATGEERTVCTESTAHQEAPATDGTTVVFTDERNRDTSGRDVYRGVVDTTAPTTTSDVKATYAGEAVITLSAEDEPYGSGVYKTYYKVDHVGAWYDGPFTADQPGEFTIDRPGEHTLRYKTYDNAGNREDYHVEHFSVTSVDTEYTEIEGPDRYDTAIASAKEAFPNGADCVVIATGVNWPDALGGAALASAKHAPILLTTPDALPANVLAEIDRLGADEAIILGGEGAVSAEVEAALEAKLGGTEAAGVAGADVSGAPSTEPAEDPVTRIGGANRYETADLVAKATYEAMGYSPYKVLVATGDDFPDALGASPLAALGPWPIVLAPEEGMTAGTKQTVDEIGSGYGVILGGEGAVSTTVEDELLEMFGEGKVRRLAGDTRYETSIACAEFGVAHGLFWDGVAISTGANFPDALAGGILQGEAGSVLLLTPGDSLHPSVAQTLTEQRDWIGNVTYLGGTGAVSQAVRDEVAQLLK